MIKILFICHGNICRSPIAEFIMKDIVNNSSNYIIDSKATSYEEIGNDIYPPAKDIMDKYHIRYSKRKANRTTKDDYNYYDYIICMDNNNYRNLLNIYGSDKDNKISLLLDREVSDPWYTGNFEETYQDILEGCNKLYERIKDID